MDEVDKKFVSGLVGPLSDLIWFWQFHINASAWDTYLIICVQELLVENLGHTAFNLTETKNQGDFSPDENLSAHKIQAKAGLKEVFMGRSEYELINIYNKLLDRYEPLKSTAQLLSYSPLITESSF